MRKFLTVLHLIRLENTLVTFLAVFLPLLVHSRDVRESFCKAAPMLFISICTYVANDLDDIERDRVNHPERPLPSQQISPTIAAFLFFLALAITLLSIRAYVGPKVAFWYYTLTIISISYRYIVEWLPVVKAPYVAIAITFPVLIVANTYSEERSLYLIAGAIFCHSLGREICKNVLDRAGDPISIMHRISPAALAVFGFSIQTVGLLLLMPIAAGFLDALAIAVMTLLLAVSATQWFNFRKYYRALICTKVQFLLGLYFLARTA